MKTCFKCGIEKPLTEFYKHKQMGDGHLNKCKECAKNDATNHRNNNLEKVKAYDRQRGNLPHRVKARKEYVKTDQGKIAMRRGAKRYIEKYPKKAKAHNALSNAIRDGKIIRPDECSSCGIKCVPHGHHWSYEEQHRLDVIWLCVHCHLDIHHN